jgi:hypothetical protein
MKHDPKSRQFSRESALIPAFSPRRRRLRIQPNCYPKILRWIASGLADSVGRCAADLPLHKPSHRFRAATDEKISVAVLNLREIPEVQGFKARNSVLAKSLPGGEGLKAPSLKQGIRFDFLIVILIVIVIETTPEIRITRMIMIMKSARHGNPAA